MDKSEKELLFKDLSARLPYHVRVKVWLKDGTTEEGFLDLEHNYADVLRDAFYYNKIIDIKPYLRPMSSMTEEEKEEFHKLKQFSVTVVMPNGVSLIKPTYIVDLEDDGNGLNYLYDWLNKKMFDYRGLISKNLAIEASEGMYEK